MNEDLRSSSMWLFSWIKRRGCLWNTSSLTSIDPARNLLWSLVSKGLALLWADWMFNLWPSNWDLSTYPIIGRIHLDDLLCHRNGSAADKLTKRSRVCVCVCFFMYVFVSLEAERNREQKCLSERVSVTPSPTSPPLSVSLILPFVSLSKISTFSFWNIAAERKQQFVILCVFLWLCVHACCSPGPCFSLISAWYQFHTERQQADIRTSAHPLSCLVFHVMGREFLNYAPFQFKSSSTTEPCLSQRLEAALAN